MFCRQNKNQAGFALLIFLVIMMGLGGIALTGVTQGILKQVEDKKFKHNDRVLKEAKQALLQFAYNNPVTNGSGPGRLPCADIDNDGLPNSCNGFGRLPWRQQNLNLYDIRDADGERLWYAVSSNFRTFGGSVNSDSSGRISIRDQSGNIIYDGSNPGGLTKYGVAAVIIAPGSVTSRNGVQQDRSVANGDDPFDLATDTDPGIILETNYLDRVVATEDNATFIQGTADGFILGPVNGQTTDAVNDQIIIITAAEVIAMAEKATLQAYRSAIDAYRTRFPGFDAYPWLEDYTTITTALPPYDAGVGVRLGRVPSIFSNYFDDAPTSPASRPIISDLEMEIVPPLTLTVNGFSVPLIDPGIISAGASIQFNQAGDLLVTPLSSPLNTIPRFYWDERSGANGWEQCLPVINGDLRDCNQSSLNPGVTDGNLPSNDVTMRILVVSTLGNLSPPGTYTRPFAGNAGNPPIYRAPTAGAHATVEFEYIDSTPEIVANWEYDSSYQNTYTVEKSGEFNYRLSVRYYPELPEWAVNDDWHDSVQMAFSSGFEPDAAANCTPGTDCLTVNNVPGIVNDKQAVLVLASDHGISDNNATGYQDDLDDIFDSEHTQADGVGGQDVFDARSGNDQVMIIR